jgi:hypothetical protein
LVLFCDKFLGRCKFVFLLWNTYIFIFLYFEESETLNLKLFVTYFQNTYIAYRIPTIDKNSEECSRKFLIFYYFTWKIMNQVLPEKRYQRWKLCYCSSKSSEVLVGMERKFFKDLLSTGIKICNNLTNSWVQGVPAQVGLNVWHFRVPIAVYSLILEAIKCSVCCYD